MYRIRSGKQKYFTPSQITKINSRQTSVCPRVYRMNKTRKLGGKYRLRHVQFIKKTKGRKNIKY